MNGELHVRIDRGRLVSGDTLVDERETFGPRSTPGTCQGRPSRLPYPDSDGGYGPHEVPLRATIAPVRPTRSISAAPTPLGIVEPHRHPRPDLKDPTVVSKEAVPNNRVSGRHNSARVSRC